MDTAVNSNPRLPVINPDGRSIKGCSLIYAPAGQAGEYAPLATNPYRGCGHGCAYCYVPTLTQTLDWKDYTHRMIAKLQALGKAHYIKKDLQKYLPPGYQNLLRIPQHH